MCKLSFFSNGVIVEAVVQFLGIPQGSRIKFQPILKGLILYDALPLNVM
jgi:hypothetical protein